MAALVAHNHAPPSCDRDESVRAAPASRPELWASTPTMDPLTVFGALAVSAMLLFYALEQRSPAYVLAFAGACLASSAYGFLQGAWPFGVVELIWSGVALRRWLSRVRSATP